MSDKRVSIIIPAYQSQETIGKSLQSFINQTYKPVEIIIIDSSVDDQTYQALAAFEPNITYIRWEERLLPHAARNRAADLANGDLLLFTDPDVYAPPNWVSELVNAHNKTGHVITGSIRCYGNRWLDAGTHLTKYDQWLSGGSARPIEIGPTSMLLCPQPLFKEMGGLQEDAMISDSVFSWNLHSAGYTIWFAPNAAVDHHHSGSWRSLNQSMFQRGQELARIRLSQSDRPWWQTVVSLLLPIRLVKLLFRIGFNSVRAGQTLNYIRTFPIILTSQSAWLLGEASVYLS